MKVYSKLPHGVKFTVGGVPVTINGSNTPGCLLPDHGVSNVPDDYWEELLAIYGSHKAIYNGHIFAANDIVDAESIAEEHEGEKTGMEQIDPKALQGVEPSDDKSPEIAAVTKKVTGK